MAIDESRVKTRIAERNRRSFLRDFGAVGVGAFGAAILAGCGGGSGNGSADAAGFGNLTRAFKDIKTDEDNHVAFLKSALGASARPAPTFDTTLAVFKPASLNDFYALSVALENTGTGAYTYATQYLVTAPAVLVAGASIGLVEGRHAGFLNQLTGRPLLTDPNSPNDTADPTNAVAGGNYSMEVPLPPSKVASRAQPFLVNLKLNGGPGVPNDQFSDQGDTVTAVLNYALLLEYLEMTFYDINVPKFFP